MLMLSPAGFQENQVGGAVALLSRPSTNDSSFPTIERGTVTE